MSEQDPSERESSEAAKTAEHVSLGERVVRELKSRPLAWLTAGVLLAIAPILLKMIFPDATPGVLIAGTIAFAAYAAACTVPGRFL